MEGTRKVVDTSETACLPRAGGVDIIRQVSKKSRAVHHDILIELESES